RSALAGCAVTRGVTTDCRQSRSFAGSRAMRPIVFGSDEPMASGSYNADSITVLEGLEAVRRRPGMYIGGVDKAGLHHLLWEVVDNAVDEVMNGHATRIIVTLHGDGKTMSVADNGRGIPVDMHPKTVKS